MKNILIISDGIPGHFNQSNGVAFMISEACDCAISTHEVSWRLYTLRSACNVFAKLLLRLHSKKIARVILWMYKPINTQGYDLVIAAGGNTMPVSAAIKLVHSLPVIQLGSPRGLHSSMFNALVTVEKYFDHPSNIVAAISPNLYSPTVCSIAAQKENLSDHILFLIGGEGIGYSYKLDEWESMLMSIQALYSKVKLPISIVTSRRTSPKVEDLFQSRLKNILGDYSAWFHHGDKNFNLAALLGSAVNIFVTEDSAMMISESVSSGKPVTTIYPSNIKSPLRYENHISKYANLELIKRSPLHDLELRSQQNLNARIREHREELAKKLMRAIGW
ncbi:mitochondrial fission ELM1 family protein [Gammaproteobacteria bacterium]|nr:mitochondrial fission ELM1 family protein [Gammaproteobacteria bacterium]